MTPTLTLDPIQSDALHPVQHGFFTRRGGASSGIFQGLNCGPGSSDMAEMVADIDAVTLDRVRGYAGRLVERADMAMAVYGPAEAAPEASALRARLAA